jgi:hypothetical protein
MAARGRPHVDDQPLARAVVVMHHVGADPDTVRQAATKWLRKRRGIKPGTARARVKAIFAEYEGGAFRPVVGKNGLGVGIDFEFIIYVMDHIFGPAASARLAGNGGARLLCWSFVEDTEEDLSLHMDLLIRKVAEAIAAG